MMMNLTEKWLTLKKQMFKYYKTWLLKHQHYDNDQSNILCDSKKR